MIQEKYSKIESLAVDIGFQAAPLDPSILQADQRVREMCAENRCRKYDASWSCPPACGPLDVLSQKMHSYSDGILLTSVIPIDGDYDLDGIRKGEILHKKNFDTLVRQTRILFSNCMPLGAGSCSRCVKCTYPDAPCRFPDKLYPSMEACGLFVSRVCDQCGLKYNNGPGTITFVSLILF